MFTYQYPMNTGAATMLLITRGETLLSSKVLLGLRGDKDVFGNMWSLPGGILNAGKENARQCASRETFEELKVTVLPQEWELFMESSDVETDPRAHVINLCFMMVFDQEPNVQASDDLADARWFSLSEILQFSKMASDFKPMAFNHYDILRAGLMQFLQKEDPTFPVWS